MFSGVLGGLGGLAMAASGSSASTNQIAAATRSEDVSGPCDEAEHAGEPRCTGATTSTTVGPTTTTTAAPSAPASPAAATRTVNTAAGTVTYVEDGASLIVVRATHADGWRAEVERAVGREIEVDFRSATSRVKVDIELEDGQVRERVRTVDEATTAAAVSSDDNPATHDVGDDNGSDDVTDDRSGRGDGSDDRSGHDDGDDRSGPGDGDDHGSDG
jgi:hypothetical protein